MRTPSLTSPLQHSPKLTVVAMLVAWVLQALAGSAWAVVLMASISATSATLTTSASPHMPHSRASHATVPACHEPVGMAPVLTHAPDKGLNPPGDKPADTLGLHADAHHCCALGLCLGRLPLLQALPHAPPRSEHGPWATLALQPNLRPPI